MLRVLMNADSDEAVAFLNSSTDSFEMEPEDIDFEFEQSEDHWRWRLRMARRIAQEMAKNRMGVKAAYILGSTRNRNAGPASDINMIIQFDGDPMQKAALENWLMGWSLCLAEVNYLRTGQKSADGLLDIHFVTEAEIAAGEGIARKINAVTDSARLLPMS